MENGKLKSAQCALFLFTIVKEVRSKVNKNTQKYFILIRDIFGEIKKYGNK